MNASFVLWHSMNTTYSPSYWLIFLLWWVFMWQILMYTHSTYNEEEKDWNLRSKKRHRKQIKRKTLPKMKRKKEMMNLKYETLIKYSKICFVLTLDRTCANGSAIVMHYRQRIFWNLVSICDWEISSSFLLYFIFFFCSFTEAIKYRWKSLPNVWITITFALFLLWIDSLKDNCILENFHHIWRNRISGFSDAIPVRIKSFLFLGFDVCTFCL